MVDTATSPHMQWTDYRVIPINSNSPSSRSYRSIDSHSTIWDEHALLEEYHTSGNQDNQIPMGSNPQAYATPEKKS